MVCHLDARGTSWTSISSLPHNAKHAMNTGGGTWYLHGWCVRQRTCAALVVLFVLFNDTWQSIGSSLGLQGAWPNDCEPLSCCRGFLVGPRFQQLLHNLAVPAASCKHEGCIPVSLACFLISPPPPAAAGAPRCAHFQLQP